MKGYVVVYEGDDETGYSAYSPTLPGVVAAADSWEEITQLMPEAMAFHIEGLIASGDAVPEPAEIAEVTVIDPTAA